MQTEDKQETNRRQTKDKQKTNRKQTGNTDTPTHRRRQTHSFPMSTNASKASTDFMQHTNTPEDRYKNSYVQREIEHKQFGAQHRSFKSVCGAYVTVVP